MTSSNSEIGLIQDAPVQDAPVQDAPVQDAPVQDAPVSIRPKPLKNALNLFRQFDESQVRYCHFKSNEHLLDGLAGRTDLDVLIDHRHARAAHGALACCGFKRFATKFGVAYPAIEDYMGFDDATGRLIHVQLHYSLVLGEKHLKGYQLRFDNEILDTRVADDVTNHYISDPNYEMLLLLVRFALKVRFRDRVLELFGRSYFRGRALGEFRWLKGRTDPERLRILTETEFGEKAGAMVDGLTVAPPSIRKLGKFRSSAADTLSRDRTCGPIEARPLRMAREFFWVLGGLNKRYFHLPMAFRLTNPTGGRIIAVLGADGSGKSTITKKIHTWLTWTLDVYPVYLGSGDGRCSLIRWPMRLAFRVLGPFLRRHYPAPPRDDTGDGTGSRYRRVSPARALWALVLALEKQSKMRAVVKARNRGMIVVCDRFPQIQVRDFDGPMLVSWRESSSLVLRRLGQWESKIYRQLVDIAPDLVIKLEVPPEVAVIRAPDMSLEESRWRMAAVRQIKYGRGSQTLVIDGTRPLDEVLLGVKKAIWEQL